MKLGGSDYQQSQADDYDEMKLNPVTGNCVLKVQRLCLLGHTRNCRAQFQLEANFS